LDRQSRLVERQLAQGWDVCCVGHTHAPGLTRLPGGLHVNLGDWMEHRTFAVIDEEVQLYRWHEGRAQPVVGPPRRRLEWGVGRY
jgi:predicted phosphodiesterase